MYPTPFVEGQKDKSILGCESLPANSPLAVSRAQNGWRLNAGELRGLTPGTVLAVRGPASDKIVGHVRLTQMGVQSAVATPCEYAGAPLPSNFPQNNRCEIVFHGVAPRRLKVAIDDVEDSGQPVSREELQRLQKELNTLKDANDPLFELIDKPPGADWLIRVRGEELVLVPGRNTAGQKSDDPRSFGPIPSDAVADWLKTRIARIARAQNLIRLATLTEKPSPQSPLKIELLRYERDAPGAKHETLRWSSNGVKLTPGTTIGLSVENNTPADIDLCVLLVDSEFGIQQLFPRPGNSDNRIGRGAYWEERLGTTDKEDRGNYDLVVIATLSRPVASSTNLDFLNQPPLHVAPRGDEDELPAPRGELSPFGQLLLQARSGMRSGDGFPAAEADKVTIVLFSWKVS
jgi:hypothetical protein